MPPTTDSPVAETSPADSPATETPAAETSPADSTPHDSGAAVRNVRITRSRPLLSPALLRDELPLTDAAAEVVVRGRAQVSRILDREDDRLLVVVGPCSIHDPQAALDYGRRLARVAEELADDLCVVMRVYFEKPRTTLGWKGLINDPDLDGTYDVNKGLRLARRVLLEVLELGLPAGCEWLDPITPQYLADAVSWGAIGARTSESQVHRHLASGLSMPVGFKNSTTGDVQGAVDAVGASAASHVFTGVTDDGVAAILTTQGNPDCHVILRGGQSGPNHDPDSVRDLLARLADADLPERVVVDASHGNSGKDHRRQPAVIDELASQIDSGQRGLTGVMIESFLVPGRQNLEPGLGGELTYGQSITDACVGWDTTQALLRQLAGAVRGRRTR